MKNPRFRVKIPRKSQYAKISQIPSKIPELKVLLEMTPTFTGAKPPKLRSSDQKMMFTRFIVCEESTLFSLPDPIIVYIYNLKKFQSTPECSVCFTDTLFSTQQILSLIRSLYCGFQSKIEFKYCFQKVNSCIRYHIHFNHLKLYIYMYTV